MDAHAVVALVFVLEAAQDLYGVDNRRLAHQHLGEKNPGGKAGGDTKLNAIPRVMY